MTVLVITAGGWGHVVAFDNKRDASLHPVVQYGDPVLDSSDQLVDTYATYEWARLVSLAGLNLIEVSDSANLLSATEAKMMKRRTCGAIWDGLVRISRPPPDTFEGVMAMVKEDRTQAVTEGTVTMTIETTTAPAPTSRRGSGPHTNPAAIIRICSNDKGTFGPENDPYTKDTGRWKRFHALKDGMTVAEALKAEESMDTGALKAMGERGHIRFEVSDAPDNDHAGGDPEEDTSENT